jgi:hypothetical protein
VDVLKIILFPLFEILVSPFFYFLNSKRRLKEKKRKKGKKRDFKKSE